MKSPPIAVIDPLGAVNVAVILLRNPVILQLVGTIRNVTILLKLAVSALLVASIASHAGIYVERLDLLSNFRPLYAAASLMLAVLLLARRERLSAALAGLLLFANLAGVLAYPRAKAHDGAARGGELAFLTVNLWGDNADGNKVMAMIAEARPDIVLLQEVSPERLRLLRRLEADYPWQTHCAGRLRCRVAVLSKHPWKRAEARIVHPGTLPLARVEFGKALGNLLVLNAHLTRPYRGSQRQQLQTVERAIADWTGPVVLGGDFNATPWSWTLRRFSQDSRLRAAAPYQPSWPRRLRLAGRDVSFPPLPFAPLQLQLDQIWLSDEASVVSTKRGADIGSDHMPLIVRLRLPTRHVLVSGPARN